MKTMAGLLPNEILTHHVRLLQEDLKEQFGTKIIRMMPHITMKAPFTTTEAEHKRFKELLADFPMIPVSMNPKGFESFGHAIYVSFEISDEWKQLSEDFNLYMQTNGIELNTYEKNRVPHITLVKGAIPTDAIMKYLGSPEPVEALERLGMFIVPMEVTELTTFRKDSWGIG